MHHGPPSSWPAEAERTYERVRSLGMGAYGRVWMARLRRGEGEDVAVGGDRSRGSASADPHKTNCAERGGRRGRDGDGGLVAMKVIDTSSVPSGSAYAAREIAILREVDHPNVVRLIRAYEEKVAEEDEEEAAAADGGEAAASDANDDDGCDNDDNSRRIRRRSGRLVVLSLARGPNLRAVLNVGGALGLPLARLASRHVVAAVSYLHSRAVIHRDVKPDNLVLDMGGHSNGTSWEANDAIWTDGPEAEMVMEREGWKVVLVDLGFARALTPEDMGRERTEPGETDSESSSIDVEEDEDRDAERAFVGNDSALGEEMIQPENRVCTVVSNLGRTASLTFASTDSKTAAAGEENAEGLSKGDDVYAKQERRRRKPEHQHQHQHQMEQSVAARVLLRELSALGTRAYSAPETMRCRKNLDYNKRCCKTATEAKAYSEYVADYTILADAYAVGRTLREVLTGVPATEADVDGTVRAYRFTKYLSGLGVRSVTSVTGAPSHGGKDENSVCNSKHHHHHHRRRRRPRNLRLTSEVPDDATALIRDLTRRRAEERITVWIAQLYPWICGGGTSTGGGEKRYDIPQGDVPSGPAGPVVFLKCASSTARAQKSSNSSNNGTRTRNITLLAQKAQTPQESAAYKIRIV